MNFDNFVIQKIGSRLQPQDLNKCLDYQKICLQKQQQVSLGQILLYGKFINPQQYSLLENEYNVVVGNSNTAKWEAVEEDTLDILSQSKLVYLQMMENALSLQTIKWYRYGILRQKVAKNVGTRMLLPLVFTYVIQLTLSQHLVMAK